jgi:hypothetical protein
VRTTAKGPPMADSGATRSTRVPNDETLTGSANLEVMGLHHTQKRLRYWKSIPKIPFASRTPIADQLRSMSH